MKKTWGNSLYLFVSGLIFCSQLNAAVFTADITGTVTSIVNDSGHSELSKVDRIVATYSYETTKATNVNSLYENALVDFQIILYSGATQYSWNLGDFTGNTTGIVETNSGNSTDRLLIQSSASTVAGTSLTNVTPPTVSIPTQISLSFDSDSLTPMLSSDALPLLVPETSTASICLRFDASALTACGVDPLDVVINFDPVTLPRKERYQWAFPGPQGNKLSDIIWNDQSKTLLAIGHNGTIMTSSNGTAWSLREIATDENFNSVIWANNHYVIVGRNVILTSEDGIQWQQRNTLIAPASDRFSDIIWDGNQFVVLGQRTIGSANTLLFATSPDGFAWTISESTISPGFLGLSWNGTEYIIVGSSGRVQYSKDLDTWNPATNANTKSLYSVASNSTTSVAAGSLGTIVTSGDSGRTWEIFTYTGPPTGIANPGTINKVRWLNNQFVIVTTSGKILTSPNGTTWTTATDSGTTNQLFGVSNAGSKYIAVGEGGRIVVSSDANTWTRLNTDNIESFNDVLWSGSQFVAVGNNGNILTSDDGINWSARDSGSAKLYSVTLGKSNGTDMYVAVGEQGTVLRSLDGLTWDLQNSGLISTDVLNRVVWVSNDNFSLFVAVGSNGLITTSLDGQAWDPAVSGTTANIFDLTWNGEVIVAVGLNPNVNVSSPILVSTDGTNWTLVSEDKVNAFSKITSISWSGSKFLAVGDGPSNDILLSATGYDWTPEFNGTLGLSLDYVKWIGDKYFALGKTPGRENILTSPDGLNWTTEQALFSTGLHFGIAKSTTNLVIANGSVGINYKLGNYIDNLAPIADAGANRTVVGTATVTINGSGFDNDLDGTIEYYRWEQIAGPSLSFNDGVLDQETLSFKPLVAADNQDYTFRLRVSDNHGAIGYDDVVVTVEPKPPGGDSSSGGGSPSTMFLLYLTMLVVWRQRRVTNSRRLIN